MLLDKWSKFKKAQIFDKNKIIDQALNHLLLEVQVQANKNVIDALV